MMRLTLPLIGFVFCLGCVPKKVMRNAETYTAEIAASLSRESDAAQALLVAAKKASTLEECIFYAKPALVIQTYAQVQHYRSLWLAGLPYPTEGTSTLSEQPDPRPITLVMPDTKDWCIAIGVKDAD